MHKPLLTGLLLCALLACAAGAAGSRQKDGDAVVTWEYTGFRYSGNTLSHPSSNGQLKSPCYSAILLARGSERHAFSKGKQYQKASWANGSFSLRWTGLYTPGALSSFSGRGSGTWKASGIPRRCRANGAGASASGTYTFRGTFDAEGNGTQQYVLHRFAPST
jgi:hypothetical protein